jgi:hypothetical protein
VHAVRRAKAKRPAEKVAIIAERVETERRKLQRASAVLLALVYSLDRGLDTEQAGDVASSALELIEQAVGALDIVTLTQRAR